MSENLSWFKLQDFNPDSLMNSMQLNSLAFKSSLFSLGVILILRQNRSAVDISTIKKHDVTQKSQHGG